MNGVKHLKCGLKAVNSDLRRFRGGKIKRFVYFCRKSFESVLGKSALLPILVSFFILSKAVITKLEI